MQLNRYGIAGILATLQQRVGGFPCLHVHEQDQRIDWGSLAPFTNHDLPAANLGQSADYRWSLEPYRAGLHGLYYPAWRAIRFHLDRNDATRFAAEHIVRDTEIAPKAGLGAFVGYLIGGPVGVVVGGAIGALVGKETESPPSSVWWLETLREDGYWLVVRIQG
jgi:hypothetical protein